MGSAACKTRRPDEGGPCCHGAPCRVSWGAVARVSGWRRAVSALSIPLSPCLPCALPGCVAGRSDVRPRPPRHRHIRHRTKVYRASHSCRSSVCVGSEGARSAFGAGPPWAGVIRPAAAVCGEGTARSRQKPSEISLAFPDKFRQEKFLLLADVPGIPPAGVDGQTGQHSRYLVRFDDTSFGQALNARQRQGSRRRAARTGSWRRKRGRAPRGVTRGSAILTLLLVKL